MEFNKLKILFMVSAFNGLSQKVWCELNGSFGKSELMIGVNATAIKKMQPDVILCPFMKDYIPDKIWQNFPCLIIHPGPANDGGPSSLNWAVLEGIKIWGVTVLLAAKGWDNGKILATGEFEMPNYSVSSIYRNEVADLAIQLILPALNNLYSNKSEIPKPQLIYKPAIQQQDLVVNWSEDTEIILRRINAGDSSPGTNATINNKVYKLFGAKKNSDTGKPGEILNITDDFISIATKDASINIQRIADDDGVKLRPSSFKF